MVMLSQIQSPKKDLDPRGNQFSNIDFSGIMDAEQAEPINPGEDKEYVQRVLEAPEKVAELVAERGTLLDQFTMAETAGGIGKNILGVVAAPFQMLESGISNPVIEMQKGNFNPIDLISESAKGFAGIKRGEFGDLYRQAGVNEFASASAGLATSFITPIALAKIGSKFSKVAKFADKAIKSSVSRFTQKVKGPSKTPIYNNTMKQLVKFGKKMKYGEGAMNKVGAKVGAYYDDIGDVAVNQNKFLDELSNMTTSVKKSITDLPAGKLRQVEDELLNLADKGNVHAVHSAKAVVDDLINNFFTSSSKSQKLLRNSSKNLGKLIDDAVYDSKVLKIGEKGARKYLNNFQKARKDYATLKNGYASIQKKLINPQTGEPTRTGQILKEISDPRNIDVRTTLESINKYGTGARRFAQDMENINKSIRFREFVGSAAESAGRGLIIGATAGQVLKGTDRGQGGFDLGGQ